MNAWHDLDDAAAKIAEAIALLARASATLPGDEKHVCVAAIRKLGNLEKALREAAAPF